MTKSAISRTSMSDAVSLTTAISMISPMIEVTGPICGLVARGSRSRASAKRSETSCRLR